MSYNPAKDKPKTVEQWHICVNYWLAKEDEKAAADPKYQKQTREQIESQFACYRPQAALEIPVEIELTPEQELQLARAQIDAETSAAILAGFDYEIGGETLHFNYDSFDQQNFADTANACILSKSGAEGLPESVVWNGYKADGTLVRLTLTADEFLALYMQGALAHKAACMEAGGVKKAALGAA